MATSSYYERSERETLLLWGLSLAFLILCLVHWVGATWVIWSTMLETDTNQQLDLVIWLIVSRTGILFPLTLAGLGTACLYVALGLLRGRHNAYRWGMLLVIWVGASLFILTLSAYNSDLVNVLFNFPLDSNLPAWILMGAVLVYVIALYIILRASESTFTRSRDPIDHNTHNAWRFLLPSVVILTLLGGIPLEQIVIASFSNQSFGITRETEYVGAENYVELLNTQVIPCDPNVFSSVNACEDVFYDTDRYRQFDIVYQPTVGETTYFVVSQDPDFTQAVWDTVIFTVVSVILELILGLMLAQVLVVKFFAQDAMRVIALIPYAVPTVVSTFFWAVMLAGDRTGFLNQILLYTNVIDQPVAWLTERAWQLPMLIFVDVWKTTPYMAFFLIPGLLMIPKDVYEAAAVDGAGAMRRFFSITLPITMPFIGVAVLFRALNALRVFDVFDLLVGERRFSMASYTQDVLIDGRMGYSSATGVVMFVIITVLVYFYLRTQQVGANDNG